MIEKEKQEKLEKAYQNLDAMNELINKFTLPIKFGNLSTQGKWGSTLKEKSVPYPEPRSTEKVNN